jgi:VanZ family protein
VNPVLRPELRFRRLWFWVGLAFAALVAYVCLVPSKNLPNIHLWDKFEHALAFLMLAFWFGCVVVRRDILWVGLCLLAFGGLIELLQGWMSVGRSADPRDLLADGGGVMLGLLLVLSPLGSVPAWLEGRLFGVRA